MQKTRERTALTNTCDVPFLEEIKTSLSAEQCLELVCDYFQVLDRTIETYGGDTLIDYLDAIQAGPRQTFQPMDDLLDAVREYATPLLGESIAAQAAEDIQRSPLVLTANHHGIAYFAQDFQGSVIFALNRVRKQSSLRTVPIFACGTVPLDNMTYPLGLLCYRTGDEDVREVPKKIPIFSNKMRRQMVSCAKPFDRDMITQAGRRVKKLIDARIICATLEQPIQTLLCDEYRRSPAIDLPSYSHQAVVVNRGIWNRLFQGLHHAPELVTLELEKISTLLLVTDLKNTDSLAHCALFDPALRENIFAELDGKRACWQTKLLLGRLHADYSGKKPDPAPGGCGTMLFWGLDDRGRRVPLYLNTLTPKNEKLCGIDDRGNILEMPFSVTAIGDGLVRNKILPSIFTSLLVISLGRGVTCAGGYFQCDYLPAMQRGLVKALERTGGYDVAAHQVAAIPTDTYLSGMIAVMSQTAGNALIPAGPVEIIAAGGLDDTDIACMQSLTLRDAHLSALSETLQDLPAKALKTLPVNWKADLAADIARLLDGKIVIK